VTTNLELSKFNTNQQVGTATLCSDFSVPCTGYE